MSDQQKEIKFKFAIDEASFQQVKRSITELVNLGAQLHKNLGGQGGQGGTGFMSGSVGGPQTNGKTISNAQSAGPQKAIAQVFVDNANGLKALAGAGKDTMRIMTEQVKRSMEEQGRSLSALDKDLERLVKRYEAVGAAARSATSGSPYAAAAFQEQAGIAGGIQSVHIGRSERRAGIIAKQQWLEDQRQDEFNAKYGPYPSGGGGPPGFWGRAASWAGRPMGGFSGAMAGIGMAGAGAMMIGREGVASLSGTAVQDARRSGLVDPQIRRLLSGDMKTLFALQTLDGESRSDLRALVQPVKSGAIGGRLAGQLGVTLNQAGEIVGQGVGSIPGIGSLARAAGLVGADRGGGIAGAATTTNIQSNRAESMLVQAELKSKALIMENLALDQFGSELGGRAHAGRTLGVGLGMGRGSTYTDSFGRLKNMLMSKGYDENQYGASVVGLRNQAGSRFGNAAGWTAMAAQAEGLGGFDQLLGTAARSGGGMGFAMGAVGGGIDRYAGVQLGGGILGQGFDPRGTTSGLGVLAAAQSGMSWGGGAGDFQKVGQIREGMGLLDSLTTGSLDPYQGARNLVGAINRNPNSGVYAQDFLANGMSSKQMMDMMRGGELTASARGHGFSREDITAQFGDSVSSVLDRWYDDGVSDDPISKSMRAFNKSGQTLPDYLKGIQDPADWLDAKNNLGALYGGMTGKGDEAGIGAMALLAGDTSAPIQEGRVGRGLTGSTAVAFESLATSAGKVTDALELNAKRMEDAYKAAPEAIDTFNKFNDKVIEGADKFTEALLKMTDALNAARTRMSGGNVWKAKGK